MCSQKHRSYWITFFSYAAIHSIRMCYSFNKANVQKQFQLSQFYLGLLDAIIYLSYAFGVLLRYQFFEGQSKMNKVYFISATIISTCFGIIAYLSLFQDNIERASSQIVTKILLTVGVFAFGFFHMALYQISGSIVSGYYDTKTQSAKIGFWGATSSVGNITGFFVSNLFVEQLHLKWQVTFFFFALINLIMAFIVLFSLPIPKEDQSYKNQLFQLQDQNSPLDEKKQTVKQIRTKNFINFIKKTISSNVQARFVFVAYIGIKATLYTFLMWFPIFLVSKGFHSVSGYVSTLFDFGAIFGGYLMGMLQEQSYKREVSHNKNNGRVLGYALRYRTVIFIILILFIIAIFMLVHGSLYLYCPLTFLIGFFLGGTFNILSSHDLFVLGERRLLFTDMLMNVPVGIGALMVGLVQLITAFMLKMNQSHAKKGQHANYGLFFTVLFVLMCMSGILMFTRIFTRQKRKISEK